MWQCRNPSTTAKVCNISFGLSCNFIFSFLSPNSFQTVLQPPFKAHKRQTRLYLWQIGYFCLGEKKKDKEEVISPGKYLGLKNWLGQPAFPHMKYSPFFISFFLKIKGQKMHHTSSFLELWKIFQGNKKRRMVLAGVCVFIWGWQFFIKKLSGIFSF